MSKDGRNTTLSAHSEAEAFVRTANGGGTRMTVALVSGAILLVIGAAIYFSALRNAENEARHSEILTSEVREAGNAVEQLVTGQRRLVEAFAIDNQDLLNAFAEDVENEELRAEIDERLQRWFPGYFTFTLADRNGRDLVDDLEGFVGRACQISIEDFVRQLRNRSRQHSYDTVIHPQANNYHYDIMAPWRSDGVLKGVFFVSFYPHVLRDLIHSYQSPGHYLALVHKDRDYLIEVNGDGARDAISAHREISLTPEEISEIRASKDVSGSLWRLVGYVEPGLVAQQEAENWWNAALVVLFVAAAGALSLWKILALARAQTRVLGQLQVSNTNLTQLADEQAALREAAESGEKTKAQFLASMSHEIRTPLNAIIGLTDLTLKTDLSEHQREHLARVARAGRSLLGLINDILDFSKIEAGKLNIERIEYDIDEVLENLATVVGAKADENGNELIISVDRAIPTALWGDPLRLGQILINLAGNAVKFTERGEVVVDAARVEADGGEWLQFSVRDTGIGMTQEQVNRLFRPFTQADQSVTRTHGGTGLGLSISHQLVEAMGGSIWVETEQGVGSCFYFRVPYTPVEGTAPRPTFEGIDPRAIRVLVVDDNEVVRETLRDALTSLRFKVETAASGEDALDLYFGAASDARYDVVLMDWRMPGIDGLEAIRQIRGRNGEQAMPAIIMVSAEDMQGISDDLRTLGVEHCVNKPINTSFLIDTMMAFFAAGADRRPVRVLRHSDVQDPTAHRKDIHLLLAEDVELNRMVALGVLQNAGFTADVAENGQQVLEMLKAGGPERYAAVLMDIEMPEMDGLTATWKIREELGLKDLPVIAMTAHALDEERERCMEAGMNAHISKPFEAAELISTLNKWTRNSGSESTSAADIPEHVAVDRFDVEAVAKRLMLTPDKVETLLAKFLKEYQDMPGVLARLLGKGDFSEAARLTHSLKGVSLSLGLTALGEAAGDLEKRLRSGAERIEEAPIAELGELHTATCAEILRAFPALAGRRHSA